MQQRTRAEQQRRGTVAQVSNLLYRMASSLRAARTVGRVETLGRAADWKSAIQQVGNLRYFRRGFATPCFPAASGRPEGCSDQGASESPNTKLQRNSKFQA